MPLHLERYRHVIHAVGSLAIVLYFVHFYSRSMVHSAQQLADILNKLQESHPKFVLIYGFSSIYSLSSLLASPESLGRSYVVATVLVCFLESLVHTHLVMVVWMFLFIALVSLHDCFQVEAKISSTIWLHETDTLYYLLKMLMAY